jgi:hypothetical protein
MPNSQKPLNDVDRFGETVVDCKVAGGYGIGNNTVNTGYLTCNISDAIDLESNLLQSLSTPLFYGVNGNLPSTFSFTIEPTNYGNTYQHVNNVVYEQNTGGIMMNGVSTSALRQNNSYKSRQAAKNSKNSLTQEEIYQLSQ